MGEDHTIPYTQCPASLIICKSVNTASPASHFGTSVLAELSLLWLKLVKHAELQLRLLVKLGQHRRRAAAPTPCDPQQTCCLHLKLHDSWSYVTGRNCSRKHEQGNHVTTIRQRPPPVQNCCCRLLALGMQIKTCAASTAARNNPPTPAMQACTAQHSRTRMCLLLLGWHTCKAHCTAALAHAC